MKLHGDDAEPPETSRYCRCHQYSSLTKARKWCILTPSKGYMRRPTAAAQTRASFKLQSASDPCALIGAATHRKPNPRPQPTRTYGLTVLRSAEYRRNHFLLARGLSKHDQHPPSILRNSPPLPLASPTATQHPPTPSSTLYLPPPSPTPHHHPHKQHVLQRRPLHPARQRHLGLRAAQPVAPARARRPPRAVPDRPRQHQAPPAAAGRGDPGARPRARRRGAGV